MSPLSHRHYYYPNNKARSVQSTVIEVKDTIFVVTPPPEVVNLTTAVQEEPDTVQATASVSGSGTVNPNPNDVTVSLTGQEATLKQGRLTPEPSTSNPEPDETPPVRLVRPPGAGMLRLAELLVSRRTFERVFLQLVEDFRSEYFEALSQGRPGKARLIVARYWIGFAYAFVLGPLLALIDRVRSIAK